MMRWRWTSWLAFSLWLLGIALVAASYSMKAVGWQGAGNTSNGSSALLFLGFFAFATVGALVAAHVPRNAVGWILLAISLFPAANVVAEVYTYQGLVHEPGSLPGAVAFAWWYSWSWYPTLLMIGLLPLLYPTGRVPGPRWRPVLWLFVGLGALFTAGFMVIPGPLDGDKKLPDNPIGIGALGSVQGSAEKVVGLAFLLVLVSVLASVVVRFWRSQGDERQQLKWMLFAVTVLVVGLVVPGVIGISNDYLFFLAIVQFPIAIGVAMFKYRLYDIGRLINNTLVYGAVTALLGAAYAGLVLLGQAVSSSVAGGGSFVIAVSTLVVAALFLPLRRRIQRFVDRRFYRRRYDAQRTLEAFGARLREQVDLDELTVELRRVVGETMQPAHTTVWLRSDTP